MSLAVDDDRIAWIRQRVTLTLNLPTEVFDEFVAEAENGTRLFDFCSRNSKAGAIAVFSCDRWTEEIEVEEVIAAESVHESEGTPLGEGEDGAGETSAPPNGQGSAVMETAGTSAEGEPSESMPEGDPPKKHTRIETIQRVRLIVGYDRAASEFQDRLAAYFIRSLDGDLPKRAALTAAQYSMLMVNNFEFLVMAGDLLYGMANTMHNIYLPVIERGLSEYSGLPELDDSLKHELTSNISKFEQQLRLTTTSRGDRKLQMPNISITTPEQTSEDYEAVVQIEAAVKDWTAVMQSAVEHEHQKVSKHGSPLGEIEFWRERATGLSTIYEQLTTPRAQQMVQVLRLMENQNLVLFQFNFSELSKLYLEAKDNVKFLTTLERHFKHIEKGNFNTSKYYIYQC